ncbi:MAG: hypothetical protein A2464_05940 [Deltaproteobacteria bacterium RIFOXYC2_FULL_48_10]|nr:MAG: hypothetical protein A2464_05940 [Deltaproteobacteria bacterium RIFOXYC2_FULL_48_10]
MNKITFTIFMLAILNFAMPQGVYACDKQSARNVQAMIGEMGSWSEANDSITFNWGGDWDQASSSQRLGLMRTFADSDACLTGKAREIKYYRNGRLVGKASPISGIELLDK